VRKLQNNIIYAEPKAKTLKSTFEGLQPYTTHLSTNAQKWSINVQRTPNKTPSQNRKIYSFQERIWLSVIKIAGNSVRNCWQPRFRTAGLNGHMYSSVMIRNLVYFLFSISIVKYGLHISCPKTHFHCFTEIFVRIF